jgi:hypothetical protein
VAAGHLDLENAVRGPATGLSGISVQDRSRRWNLPLNSQGGIMRGHKVFLPPR